MCRWFRPAVYGIKPSDTVINLGTFWQLHLEVIIARLYKSLPLLYDPQYLGMKCHELLKTCESTEIIITSKMTRMVEQETIEKSKCKHWF